MFDVKKVKQILEHNIRLLKSKDRSKALKFINAFNNGNIIYKEKIISYFKNSNNPLFQVIYNGTNDSKYQRIKIFR